MGFIIRSEFDPRFAPVMVKYAVLGGHYCCHWHKCYELIYIERGRATLMSNLRPIALSAGYLAWIPPGVVHDSIAESDDCRALVMQFDSKLMELGGYLRTLPEYLQRVYYQHSNGAMAGAVQGVDKLLPDVSTWQHRSIAPGATFGWIGMIFQVLELLSDQCGAPGWGALPHISPEIDALCRYIEQHPRRHHSLRDSSAWCGFSEAYFSKKFHAEIGITYKGYADYIRMGEAQKMLIVEHCSVTDTAAALDDQTPQGFCRSFRRVTGHTPTACLRMVAPKWKVFDEYDEYEEDDF